MDDLNQTTDDRLKISIPSSAYLYETSKWGKFLAIMGFIFCGLIVLLAFFVGSVFSSSMAAQSSLPGLAAIGGVGITIFYIALGIVYFFPSLYLFNFANKMQSALRNKDQFELDESFKNIKSCFKYMGILTIIILSLYVLMIFFMVVVAGVAAR